MKSDNDPRCKGCYASEHKKRSCGFKYILRGVVCPCSSCLVKVTCDDVCSICYDYIDLHVKYVEGWS